MPDVTLPSPMQILMSVWKMVEEDDAIKGAQIQMVPFSAAAELVIHSLGTYAMVRCAILKHH